MQMVKKISPEEIFIAQWFLTQIPNLLKFLRAYIYKIIVAHIICLWKNIMRNV